MVIVTVVAVSAITITVMLAIALAAYYLGRQNGISEGELRRLGHEVDILMGASGRIPPGTPPSI